MEAIHFRITYIDCQFGNRLSMISPKRPGRKKPCDHLRNNFKYSTATAPAFNFSLQHKYKCIISDFTFMSWRIFMWQLIKTSEIRDMYSALFPLRCSSVLYTVHEDNNIKHANTVK